MSAWKFQQFQPPKARGNIKSVTEDWVVEEKYDGDRRIAQFCFDAVRFTGTRQSVDGSGFVEKTDNLPHLAKPALYLEGTVLDGEVICNSVPGARSKDVASIMGSSPEVAIAKQVERGWLTYAVFDCLFYRGADIRHRSLAERREFMARAVREWKREAGRMIHRHVITVSQYLSLPSDDIFRYIVKLGGEGIIYKNPRSKYGDQRAWVKRKQEATYDVVILDFQPGKGKYLGQIGAVKFGQYRDGEMVYCGKCSGMDDELRAELSRVPKVYLGKVLEIKANAREPSGKFRHPQFVQLRHDKNPKDCVFNLGEQ